MSQTHCSTALYAVLPWQGCFEPTFVFLCGERYDKCEEYIREHLPANPWLGRMCLHADEYKFFEPGTQICKCVTMDLAIEEREIHADGKMQVSLYTQDRCYGGAEEGGWYYDAYQFTGISMRCYPEDIEEKREELKRLAAQFQPRYPIESVLSDAPEYTTFVETYCGEYQTKGRPHYE